MKHHFRSGCFIALLWLLASAAQTAFAQQPQIPESDDEVLLVLPKSFLANRDELSVLRDELNANPADPSRAAAVASEYLKLGKRSGDPRFYGYARAAINRWWETGASPPILKIRAELKEKDHQFDDALVDLKSAFDLALPDLKRAAAQGSDDLPVRKNFTADILLAIANIYRVQGRYDEALKVGDQIQSIAGDIPAALCRAPIMAQTGQAKEAYELLSEVLVEAKTKLPFLVPYLLTLRAEIAGVLGKEDEVKKHFTEGIEADPGDFYLLRGYGDYLLDRDQAEQALALLREHTNDTGVLLRAAIAAQQSGQAELSETWTSELETRFKELRLRGGQPHGRFESRLLLALKDTPDAALEVALANWQKQKEVRDTRNVLEAAIAAGKPEAAEPIIEFLRKNNNEHVKLKELIEQLENTK